MHIKRYLKYKVMKEDFKDFIEASGLLEYDPNTITKIYRKNPKRLFKRLWQTLVPIFAYIISVGLDKITGKLKDESQSRHRAKQLTNLLVELGPAFVKAGQALSTRPDIIPVVLLEELSQLQDQLPGFSGDKAMELCLLYTSPSPRDGFTSRMPSSA